MSSVEDKNVDVRLVLRQYAEQQREIERLKSGDGGGTFDGMEPRVAKLESDMEHVKKGLDRLADVPANLATITERISHLPTKDELGTKLRNWMLLGAGVTTAAVTVVRLFINP